MASVRQTSHAINVLWSGLQTELIKHCVDEFRPNHAPEKRRDCKPFLRYLLSRIVLGRGPDVVGEEHRPALVAQQVGGHQGGSDPAGLFEPGTAGTESTDEGLFGLGVYGVKRDEVEHRLSFQGWRHTTACAQVGARGGRYRFVVG